MKKIFLISGTICLLLSYGCANTVKSKKLLLEQNLAENVNGWQIQDTIVKQFDFVYQELKMPMKITWVTAKDPSGCLRVATMRLEKVQKKNAFEFEDIQISQLPCAVKSDSNDSAQFETVVIFGKFRTFVGDKEYNYDNSILNISGSGELTNMTR